MAGFFEAFFNIDGEYNEAHVRCPFPHSSDEKGEHFDSIASASVNIEKRLFHCSCCGRGYTEVQFVQQLLKTTTPKAHKLLSSFEHSISKEEWDDKTLYATGIELAESKGINKSALIDVKVKSNEHDPDSILVPVFMFGRVVDVRRYQPNHQPKVLSQKGAPTGLVVPEHALTSDKVLWLCEGEHDMLVMRSHNLNAVCLTGGAGATPICLEQFVGSKVAIVYDNDDAGIAGAEALANALVSVAAEVRNITLHHSVCTGKGEDIADYFCKYNKTREDLIQCYKQTDVWSYTKHESKKVSRYTKLTLEEAEHVDNIGKLIQTDVQVCGTNDDTYAIPTYINCTKIAEGAGEMDEGMQADWELNDNNLRDVAKICAVATDDNALRDRYKDLCKVMHTEKNIAVRVDNMTNVYIATVSDTSSDNPREITVYSVGHKLESGHKYTITHKVVQSPKTAGLLISVATDVTEMSSSVDTFELNTTTVGHLTKFQALGTTVNDKVTVLTEKVKGLLGYNGNNELIKTIDLAYHTPLFFNFGRFKNVRGYLDTLVIGESRVGKSSTAQTLLDHYGLGTFVSLAGNSATVPALIGGSNKTSTGQNQTKAGVIPMNHKGLIIFEEFGKCANNITAELTDVRSSNEVRINRVSGSLTLPAYVRMITLSNVKPTANGDIRPINSYPNGIAIATELVPTAEDIARYDMVLISAYKGEKTIDPLWEPDEPMTDEEYRTRINWVWSRRPEQIVFAEGVPEYIVELANILNESYECHIKIFGTECWKKLARLSIAVAGYTVSASDDYESIIVTRDCVNYACGMLEKMYDNDTFRLREYVNNERKYSTIDKAGIELLGQLWNKSDTLLKAMDEEATPTKDSLKAACGEAEDDFNGIMRELSRANMITINGKNINPTVRFRKGMALCKKDDWRIDKVYERLE